MRWGMGWTWQWWWRWWWRRLMVGVYRSNCLRAVILFSLAAHTLKRFVLPSFWGNNAVQAFPFLSNLQLRATYFVFTFSTRNGVDGYGDLTQDSFQGRVLLYTAHPNLYMRTPKYFFLGSAWSIKWHDRAGFSVRLENVFFIALKALKKIFHISYLDARLFYSTCFVYMHQNGRKKACTYENSQFHLFRRLETHYIHHL